MLRVVDETAGPAEQPAVDLLRHEIRIRKLRRRRNVIGRILVPVTAGYRTDPGRIGPCNQFREENALFKPHVTRIVSGIVRIVDHHRIARSGQKPG